MVCNKNIHSENHDLSIFSRSSSLIFDYSSELSFKLKSRKYNNKKTNQRGEQYG